MSDDQYRPSRVSTVLAVVFGALTGLFCLAVFLGAVAALGATDRVALLVLVALLYGACAASCLTGGVLLLMRRDAGITTLTAGGILGLVIVLAELVVGALPENAAATDPAPLGALLLFTVLALVQVRRKDTRHWVGQ